MTKLSVNINKLATLRNSRGKNNPDILKATLEIISYGAQGITVHPRPDERHIRKKDVYDIAKIIDVEFNIEGYPSQDFLTMVKAVKPTQCTLVPDPPDVLTSNAGWLIEKNLSFLQTVISELQSQGIRTALFIDPASMDENEIHALKATHTDRVELYTQEYAETYDTAAMGTTLKRYQNVARMISELGIDLNAGHDLNLNNLKKFIKTIPMIKEVSIGHALICDALNFGMKETITRYLGCLR